MNKHDDSMSEQGKQQFDQVVKMARESILAADRRRRFDSAIANTTAIIMALAFTIMVGCLIYKSFFWKD